MTSLTCSWQGMREESGPEQFFHVAEVCMAACRGTSVCHSTSLAVLCCACVARDGRLDTAPGWGRSHKPGNSSLQSCSSLCPCPRRGQCRVCRLGSLPRSLQWLSHELFQLSRCLLEGQMWPRAWEIPECGA